MPAATRFWTANQKAIGIAAFTGRATPRIIDHIRSQSGVRVTAINAGGGDEPLVALCIRGRCSRTTIHVPAANPACAGSHTNLVAAAIISHHGAHGVCAVTIVITGGGGIGPTGITGVAIMNGIVPVVVMISRGAIPTAILVNLSGMIPLIAGVLSTNDHPLTGIAKIPNLRRFNQTDIPFNCIRLYVRRTIHGWSVQGDAGVGV